MILVNELAIPIKSWTGIRSKTYLDSDGLILRMPSIFCRTPKYTKGLRPEKPVFIRLVRMIKEWDMATPAAGRAFVRGSWQGIAHAAILRSFGGRLP